MTRTITLGDLAASCMRYEARHRARAAGRLAASARAALSLDGGPRRRPTPPREAARSFHAPETAGTCGAGETAREACQAILGEWKSRRRKGREGSGKAA